MNIKTGNFTGTGSDGATVTGIGFTPDIVIVKRTNGGELAYFRQSGMAAGKSMSLRGDGGVEDNKIKSLDSDGFTLGTDSAVNASSVVYVYIAMKKVTADADFDFGTYTGNGSDSRSIQLQATFPFNWLVIKGDGGRTGAYKDAALTGDKTHAFYFTGTNSDQIQATMSTMDGTVELGTSDFVNANGRTYYWFGFKEVSGKCTSSTYNGNGTDNRDITAPGFQPTWVWVKQETNSDPRFRTDGHSGDASQSFDGSQETNQIQAFISTGFTLGNNSQVNDGSGTPVYHYLAIKDQPSSGGTVVTPRLRSLLGVGL